MLINKIDFTKFTVISKFNLTKFFKTPTKVLDIKKQKRNVYSILRNLVKKQHPIEVDVILHIHGGGFFSQSPASHYCYLNKYNIIQ